MSEINNIILSKVLCILFSAKAGCGKTESANYVNNYLKEKYDLNGGVFPFAYGVKEASRLSFNWDGKKDQKGRALLQQVGAAGRAYDIDIWVRKAKERFYNSGAIIPDYMLVDDWRFPNEEIFMKKDPVMHVVTVRIESPTREILKGTPEYNDVSETSLQSATPILKLGLYDPGTQYSYCIGNTGKLEDLYSSLENIVDREIDKLNFVKGE